MLVPLARQPDTRSSKESQPWRTLDVCTTGLFDTVVAGSAFGAGGQGEE